MPARLSHDGREHACLSARVREINDWAARVRRPDLRTANACCGHGRCQGSIILHDGTVARV